METARTPIEPSALAERLVAEGLTSWRPVELEGGTFCLATELTFANFAEAFSFMTAVALQAERLDHHPDWTNRYNTVSIRLFTHDTGGVTEADFRLALAAEHAAAGIRSLAH